MKIRVKHKETEFIVEDDVPKTDTGYNLIYYNSSFVLQLLEQITDHIVAINKQNKNESHE
jgi:hypothetical protein